MGQKIGHPQGWRTETASKSVVIVHPDTAQGRRSPKPKPRGWRIPSFEMERILEDPGSGACSIGDIGGYWRYPRIIIFPTDSHFGRETRRRLDSLGAKTEGLGLLPRKSLQTQWHSWDV